MAILSELFRRGVEVVIRRVIDSRLLPLMLEVATRRWRFATLGVQALNGLHIAHQARAAVINGGEQEPRNGPAKCFATSIPRSSVSVASGALKTQAR